MKKENLITIISEGNTDYFSKKVEELCKKYGHTFQRSEIKTFNFEELSEKVQKEVLDRNRGINVDYNWWEYSISEWEEKLGKIGFENADIRFSGFCSQGDGASFTAYCDTQKILDTLLVCQEENTGDLKKWRLWFELAEAGLIKFDMMRISHNYVHENSVEGVLTEDFSGLNNKMWYAENPDKPYEFTSIFERKCQLRELEEMFDGYCKNLFGEIYSWLEGEYDYLTSDECIKDYLSGVEFDEWGNEVD